MKRILLQTCLLLAGLVACESNSPKPVIKKTKPDARSEHKEPRYIDHPAYDNSPNGSQYPQNMGNVPLTKNPGTAQGEVPKTSNPEAQPDANAPQNISAIWDGNDFYSNADVTIKPLVQ